ncbi:MAG: histidinol dehydrogenase [Anaerotignum sp.]
MPFLRNWNGSALLPRAEIARESIDNCSKIILAESMTQAVEISNEIAPEHLEVCVDNPFAYLAQIRHAGSIFLENTRRKPWGYFAGANHTLPTSGTARFSSPLSVDDFIKKSSFTYYTQQALEQVGEKNCALCGRRRLAAHGKSVSVRLEKGGTL